MTGSSQTRRFHDFRFGFLKIPAMVASLAVLLSVLLMVAGEASGIGITLNWSWGLNWVLGFLTGFGLGSMAEDGDPVVPHVEPKSWWPCLGDSASIVALAGTYLVTLGRAVWNVDQVGSAMLAGLAIALGAFVYATGWLALRPKGL